MKNKVVFVINYFYPDVASTGQLLTELCLNLQNDFDITVIAAQPGYAGEESSSKKIIEEDFLENIKVLRIRLPKVNKKSKISRIKYIFSYFFLANFALLKEKKIDVVYTISQPPVLGGLIGTIGKFFKNTKHIYNIQDFNPEQAAAVNYTNKKFIFETARKIDNLNCSYSDCVILVGNDMKETLKRRFNNKNVPENVVINNWTDEKEIIPLDKENDNVKEFLNKHNLTDKFVVMYSGNIGLFYDLENIIKVSLHFKNHKNIVFVFIGEGAVKEEMENFVLSNSIQNVYFLPYQPKDYIKYSLNAADVHLVVNQKGIKGVSVPSKIYGVMAAGKPILGVLEQGSEAYSLIHKSNCGVTIEPQDYNELIKKIEELSMLEEEKLISIGMNGREYLDKFLKQEISIDKYRETINLVIKS
ncbi:glycosyltransferase family 4 protein [Jeotgalibacillus proteolyticus]|uniref:Glycosyltransferase WbuB n=1 Tax=Jeotgalibacillus proteolyticus TaxID=2082395 RepID=A0A2S5G926_9BACL|nr:glycosyltransferase family 4 protein [Jeotgalibacillus proteolyticus]PPA69496.1 glycosyltransferase WbuB [Jeotgalibacillus proteolyticus]